MQSLQIPLILEEDGNDSDVGVVGDSSGVAGDTIGVLGDGGGGGDVVGDTGGIGGDGAGLYCGVREDNISLLDIYCGLQVKPWPGHSIRPIRRY